MPSSSCELTAVCEAVAGVEPPTGVEVTPAEGAVCVSAFGLSAHPDTKAPIKIVIKIIRLVAK